MKNGPNRIFNQEGKNNEFFGMNAIYNEIIYSVGVITINSQNDYYHDQSPWLDDNHEDNIIDHHDD